MGQIQQMRLGVYKKNNELYLEGIAMDALCGSVSGKKEQYYKVSKEELDKIIKNARQYDIYISEIEYFALPYNANIYKEPLISKYIKENTILYDIHKQGLEWASSRHQEWFNVDKEEFDKILLDAMINLTNDYITEEKKDFYDAVESAARDFKCNNNTSIILQTLREISRQKKEENKQKADKEEQRRIANFELTQEEWAEMLMPAPRYR